MGAKITKIGITSDKISARGGVALFLRYVERIGIYSVIFHAFSFLIKPGGKGLQLGEFLKQMFAFLIDGSYTSISYFDTLKSDQAYSALLENKPDEMASSHQVKRYFSKLSVIGDLVFNKILHELFIWRLKIDRPKLITLGVDTMVLDNDGAQKREGSEPTYKKKKGFQPLHISWGPFLVDVLFRKGSAHSNHGTDYTDRIRAVVQLIRKRYCDRVAITVCSDSGFADQKAFRVFEDELGIHFISTSRIYSGTKKNIEEIPLEGYAVLKKRKQSWSYVEFGDKPKSWDRFRRCIYTKLNCDKTGQYVMEFEKTDNLIYTNIGNCEVADHKLRAAGEEHMFQADAIIKASHSRGADELIHRSIKELATKEQLPFKSFGANRVYYFLLVIVHFLFESYKRDVTAQVLPEVSYPNTFRRKLIDFAVKITSGSRAVKLNVSPTTHQTININQLWKRCQSPPPMPFLAAA